MLKSLKIAALTNLFGALIALGFVVVAGTGMLAINELKVGGPVYQRIVLGKDLIADILPPPEYVIEAYLEVTLALNDPSTVKQRRDRLAQLRKDYNDRHAYWAKQDIDPTIRERLTVTSHASATAFWAEVEGTFLPGLSSGDLATAMNSYKALTAAYGEHRAVIDSIVVNANRINEATERDADAREAQFMAAVWIVSALVLVVVALGVLGILNRVIRPVTQLTGVMHAMAEGNLSVAIPVNERQDEIGAMTSALRVFKEHAEADRQRRAQDMNREQVEREKQAVLLRMAETVEREAGNAVDAVAKQTSTMADNATRMADSAQAVSDNSQTVAAAATQALSNAQTVAAASEQLSASIREIAMQISTASAMTGQAVDASTHAEGTIQRLSEAVTRIGEVTTLINDVAGQTNLLALNATIEAARAGEAGKGFAVVANEVKALAGQTARATGEIESQIAAIQATTADAVKAVRAIADQVRGVETVSSTIASAVQEQEAATGEIARNVEQTTQAAQEVANRIANVSSEATATGERASAVMSLSDSVATSIDQLRHVLVETIRTATPEVNRRQFDRHLLNRPGRLRVGGQDVAVTIDNASEGGAQISGVPPSALAQLREGTAVQVMVPGIDGVVPATVRSQGRNAQLHLTFTLPASEQNRFADQFRRVVSGAALLAQPA